MILHCPLQPSACTKLKSGYPEPEGVFCSDMGCRCLHFFSAALSPALLNEVTDLYVGNVQCLLQSGKRSCELGQRLRNMWLQTWEMSSGRLWGCDLKQVRHSTNLRAWDRATAFGGKKAEGDVAMGYQISGRCCQWGAAHHFLQH